MFRESGTRAQQTEFVFDHPQEDVLVARFSHDVQLIDEASKATETAMRIIGHLGATATRVNISDHHLAMRLSERARPSSIEARVLWGLRDAGFSPLEKPKINSSLLA